MMQCTSCYIKKKLNIMAMPLQVARRDKLPANTTTTSIKRVASILLAARFALKILTWIF